MHPSLYAQNRATNLLVVCLFGSAIWLSGCPSSDGCKPISHAGTYCQDGEVYWVDSCGDIEGFMQACGCGCSTDRQGCLTPCACIPDCTNRCCGDNGCGQDCRDHCGDTGRQCDFSTCSCSGTCVPRSCQEAGYQCGYWTGADGCGGDLQCPACPDGQTCNAGGQCEGTTCQGGLTECGGQCVDTTSDDTHCGGCNKPCPAGQTCQNSSCSSEPNCPGLNLSADGVLNLDIQAVTVSGQVTLMGNQLPNEPMGRGQIMFTETESGSAVTVDLESTGPKTYQLRLAPGIYNVDYVGNPALCSEVNASLPCNTGRLHEGVNLSSDGVLHLDIPKVRIQGQVTLKGQGLPNENMDRGSLVFASPNGGSAVTRPFQSSGGFSYDLAVFPGTYDVHLDANEGLCYPNHQPEIPCIDGQLMEGLNLSSDGVLNVDIPAVKVQGVVTLKGQGLPTDPMGHDRGQVGFVNSSTGNAKYFDLGTDGAYSYQLTLLPDTYNVDYVGNAALCNHPLAAFPCNQGQLLAGLNLQSDGALNIDIPAVTVQGQVTLNGQALPNQQQGRGALIFSLADGGTAVTEPFGSSGSYTYELTILPGSYSVSLDGNETLCYMGVVPQMPCNDGLLMSDLNLQTDGVLNVDVPAVQVSGSVYLNGNNLPAENMDRGSLVFSMGESGIATKPFESSGFYQYQLTLLPGTYDVSLDANEALCTQANPPQMPCNDGPLMTGMNLNSGGVLDVDIPVISVQGQVSLEGQGLPTENQDRGLIVFALKDGGGTTSKPFQNSGGFNYELRLLPGAYVISHQANPGLCAPNQPLPSMPCNNQVLLGCD